MLALLKVPRRQTATSLAKLLLVFLKVGAIGFGGGMAIVSLMERELVRRRKLLSIEEFLHGVAFGQILGSFAVNVAFFVGYRLFGPIGGVLSSACFLLPSIVLVIALSGVYFAFHTIPALQGAVSGFGPVVIALIVDAGWSVGSRVVRSRKAAIMALSAFASGILKVNTLWILLGAGVVGLFTPRIKPNRSGSPSHQPRANAALALLPLVPSGSPFGTVVVAFLKVGFIFFGGGFLLLPILHHRLVEDLHWLTVREFLDGVAISNLTPGPIAVLATFAGYHIAGISGALGATAALMAPAAVFMAIVTSQYQRFHKDRRAQSFLAGINPAISGVILSTGFLLGREILASWRVWFLAAATLYAVRKLHWPPVIFLGLGGMLGYAGLL